jgi:hypothetical protein
MSGNRAKVCITRIPRYYFINVNLVYFGLLVWSTGLAPNPLIESIAEVAKDSKPRRFVITFCHT